ncbi:MAG: hypothetical protein CVV44_18505 [Spirochaetae bacterium HGW-Spirochaetae-1]|nr:MAG: hypothetical protein CVV44_18505 [Spirochaetae bacterium HGW-Spirochaetae-1]
MSFIRKVMLIVGICIVLSVGSYFIISMIFEKLEDQLFEKCRIEALSGARAMSEVMELMVKAGMLKEEDIFDTNYIRIEGINPPKYHTRYDLIFDQHIQLIQDEYLKDPDVDFAILIDKNGYVPTHNLKYSQPSTGKLQHDLYHSRSKRNFATYPAIKQALQYNGNDTTTLLYDRDTGEKLWNIGAPVRLHNRHWGAFLIGVSMQRVNIIKNQMLILIIVTIFAIISLSLLAALAVMPRKLFTGPRDTPQY